MTLASWPIAGSRRLMGSSGPATVTAAPRSRTAGEKKPFVLSLLPLLFGLGFVLRDPPKTSSSAPGAMLDARAQRLDD
jgi:hypothetical protein